MAKLRVYELAKELGIGNKDVLAELDKAGMGVKSHSSSIDEAQEAAVRKAYSGKSAGKAGAAGKPAEKKEQKARPKLSRPLAGMAGISKGVRPAAEAKDEDVPVMPRAATRVPVKKAAKAAPKRVERPDMATVRSVEVIRHHEEEAVEAPAAEPEAQAGLIPEAAEAVTQAATPAPAEEAAPAAPTVPAEAAEEAPSAEAEKRREKEKPEHVTIKLEPRIEAETPTVEAAPAAVEEAVPGVAGAEAPAPAAAKEAPGRPKKPKVKGGPKPPARPEIIEEFEGIERIPVIPQKLKERLQPVKKTKPVVETPPAFGKKEAPRFQRGPKPPFAKRQKGGGGGGGRPVPRLELPEEAAPVVRKKAIKITEGLTVKDFADRIGQKTGEVLKKLIGMGMMATINQPMDSDAAALIADSFGVKVEITPITDEEAYVEETVDREEDLQPRPPVVTIMGHVDHGKTSLLDAIRKTSVTLGEAGGITQHIGAYKVQLKDKEIVFLDTPGHEAFTAMRARGAQVTDIVVLVVAADDGVKPQTIEAINHARAAKVPIIVAVNKIDKPEADQDKVRRELADQGLLPEDWGGETIFAPVSAKQKIGLEALLEMILLQAEIMELKANPNKHARGTIVEAKLDKGRGPVATVLVSTGTLKQGDAFVTGQHFGRIRMLYNDRGKKVKDAGPATPVEVIGLSGVPQAGDAFVVMEDEKKARVVAQSRMQKQREAELAQKRKVSLDDLFAQIQQGEVKELNIIIKADVQGSVEALTESLVKLSTPLVKLNVIHGSVGAITESDVMLASASNAIIIGFSVRPEPKASQLAEAEDVDLRMYNIIYNAIEEVRSAMEGLLEPTLKEKVTGRAEVRQTFSVPKVGMIAGSYVLDGFINRNCAGVRVLRDNVVVYEGKIGSLKRFKDDVKEVQAGYECGIGVENFNDIKVGDVLEAYDIEKLATKL